MRLSYSFQMLCVVLGSMLLSVAWATPVERVPRLPKPPVMRPHKPYKPRIRMGDTWMPNPGVCNR